MSDARLWLDASGRLTFDADCADAADYPAMCRAVVDAFSLTPAGELIIGPEQIFWDFHRAGQSVGLDWDVWTGFMVVAKTAGAESLVRDIAAWSGTHLRRRLNLSSAARGVEDTPRHGGSER